MDLKNTFDKKAADIAIEKGMQYLCSLTVNGHWKGFPTLAGESDTWVTGFILAHICKICSDKNAIVESQQFLAACQHPSGGWSYSAPVPPDADSTSWCLMALEQGNALTAINLEKAKTFLWGHFANNAVSTYKVDTGIREFIAAPNDEIIAGWISAHPDVSIAVVLADLQNKEVPAILNWLINQQTKEGFINAYWWRGPLYTTTLLLRALTLLKLHLPQQHATLIATSLVNKQLPDGGFGLDGSGIQDPFTTALALESFAHLAYLGYEKERAQCGNALLLSQNKNGSWAGNFIMRIPAPFVINPNEVASYNNADGGGNSLIEDKDGLFATALACYALDCWMQIETTEKLAATWPVFNLINRQEYNGAEANNNSF